jgi:Ca2+-binding EF-hand superfamily protein
MQQEKTMKTSTRLALAFLTLAGIAGGVAYAGDPDDPEGAGGPPMMQGMDDPSPDGPGGPGGRHGMRFDRLDTDQSGDVTFEEFSAALKSRMGDADANHDGRMTVDEIAAAIEKMRAERMARRIVDRFDTNGDGVLTADEISSRQKKMFALLDRNDDGKIEKDEMPRRHFGRWGNRWGHGDRW